jgi:hypothetical protein
MMGTIEKGTMKMMYQTASSIMSFDSIILWQGENKRRFPEDVLLFTFFDRMYMCSGVGSVHVAR